jgi:hypothetical protein
MTLAAHITSADPLDLAEEGVIELVSIKPSTPRTYSEVMNSAGKYIAAALKVLKPLEQWDITYRLLDTASLTLTFGAAINTDYLLTAGACSCGPDKYPEVTVTAIKPSSAAMIKTYAGAAITQTFVGGFGIVNKFSATSTASFISSSCSISMQALEAMHETSGDFEEDGIYKFGFKQECQATAYAAIVIPGTAHASPNAPATPSEGEADWQIYEASWWTYLDAYVATP